VKWSFMSIQIRRREFAKLLGVTAISPLLRPVALWAQQPTKPVIGILHSSSANYFAQFEPSVRQGLAEAGVNVGKDADIEYRWAEGKYDRLPELAAELVSRQVTVIFAVGGTDPARAAKAATTTIPIVFISAADPVATGLVASLNRPGGNVTGVSLIGSALEAKRVEMLHQFAPQASTIAVLLNPNYPGAKSQIKEVQDAAATLGVTAAIFNAAAPQDIDAAFASATLKSAGALLVANDPFFNSRRQQIVELASRKGLATMYSQREYAAAGGLMTYGPHFADGYRQAGVYLGRVLKGEKPADLPVMQPVKFEFVINLKTANLLGLSVPPMLLALADEVVE
jgi:putative ABC transport system substrate-binding protein